MNAGSARPPRRRRTPKQLQRALRRMLREAAQLQAEAETLNRDAARLVCEAESRMELPEAPRSVK